MKTPYGNFLCNIENTMTKFLGEDNIVDDPIDKIKIRILINGKRFTIPKLDENAASLHRVITSFGERSPDNRKLKLYIFVLCKQESFIKMMKLFINLT